MVKVYSTSTCPYCDAVMDWLEKRGVEFEEINAEGMEDITSVPVTEIEGERIIGFDRPALKRALKRAGLI